MRKNVHSVKWKVRGPADASNFDTYPKEKELPPDELSGWDADFQTYN